MFIGDDDTPLTYGKNLLEYIENNQLLFPDSEFHHSMQIFDAQQLPLTQTLINKYGDKEIEVIGEFYGSPKTDQDNNIYEPIIDKKELKKE
ncbi:ribonuclease H-like domain-containing protein [Rhizophagus clarus]|uniref:Ribonuclease H-like domain-containing protein n=1 Tax=Rhizophagus clarus TaxID=94130 RepID=A0A8H3LZ04_9GLOM|nr:ribonuclease H-like domain-containing protein [Rhizophagus clarus]